MPNGNDQFCKSLLQFDNNIIDSNIGGQAKTWSVTGSVATNGTPKFGSGALSLSNPTGGGSVAANFIGTPAADLWLDLGDWTIDFWITPTPGTAGTILGHVVGPNISNWGWIINMAGASLAAFSLTMSLSDNGTAQSAQVSTGSGFTSGYNHVAFVYQRSTQKFMAFLNGTLKQTVTYNGSPFSSPGNVYIGGIPNNGVPGLNGLVDGFRMTIGTARWTASFTPATLPYGIDYAGSNARGLYAYAGFASLRRVSRFCARGFYALTGNAVTLLYGKIILMAAAGRYALTGIASTALKNGRPILVLLAAGGQYIMSGFTNYLLRAISKFKLGDALTLFKTRRNPPTLDV